jgi:dienelactone hydrolase
VPVVFPLYIEGVFHVKSCISAVIDFVLLRIPSVVDNIDRPGYVESDAHPARTEKSVALDIAELADNLQLGPKFHLIGFSMGGEIMWSCLNYIPHRWVL